MTYNQIVFIRRGRSSLNILTEWVLRDNFYLLRENSKKYYSAFYILKLVREFTEENNKNENLFINTLCEIANKGDPTINIVAFEEQMLAFLGYLPELIFCVNCKEKVSSKSISFFSALEGRGGEDLICL